MYDPSTLENRMASMAMPASAEPEDGDAMEVTYVHVYAMIYIMIYVQDSHSGVGVTLHMERLVVRW
jgi:hypothetical protein